MLNRFSRTELLLGKEAMDRLKNSRVAVFGIGGVGGYTVEALARSGVGTIDITDNDKICLTNINRQIYALSDTIGKYKVDVAFRRIKAINPSAAVNIHRLFLTPENVMEFDFKAFDYIVDAIDTVSAKLALIEHATAAGVPVISSMGAGNKLDPTAFEIADIYKTSVCPLARVMRHELRKKGIKKLKVVYSKEPPIVPLKYEKTPKDSTIEIDGSSIKRSIPGSNAFVPPAVGLIIASEVIKDLIGKRQ